MKTIFRAVFYLRSNYVNKEGKTPVMLRIYLNNERLSIGSTGIAVQQSQWDSEKERLKGRTTEVLSTNLELDNIQSGLQTVCCRGSRYDWRKTAIRFQQCTSHSSNSRGRIKSYTVRI